MDGHEEFRELCALSLSDELTCEERARLNEHLRTCPSCEKIFQQYRATAVSVLPQLAVEEGSIEWPQDLSWGAESAESAFLERLKARGGDELARRPSRSRSAGGRRLTEYVPPFGWKGFGMLYAASILLFLALMVASYRLGIQQRARSVTASIANSAGATRILPGDDNDRLTAELVERDKTILGLKQEIASRTTRVRETRAFLAGSTNPGNAETLSRSDRSISLDARIAELEKQLAETRRARSDEATPTTVLEAKANELAEQLRDRDEALSRQLNSLANANRLIQDRDKTIADQQDLLAHDRDIRELMGSRSLYIAEVYDVAKTGQANKPFGRVFYTKGKSLIFYAYDLDHQSGVKTASSFQVWGSEGANQGRAVSLGVFFEDSVVNKRWVLKAENAQSLEQIDSVFVTVEPKGGSLKPSGKSVLFASLRNGPNHQ